MISFTWRRQVPISLQTCLDCCFYLQTLHLFLCLVKESESLPGILGIKLSSWQDLKGEHHAGSAIGWPEVLVDAAYLFPAGYVWRCWNTPRVCSLSVCLCRCGCMPFSKSISWNPTLTNQPTQVEEHVAQSQCSRITNATSLFLGVCFPREFFNPLALWIGALNYGRNVPSCTKLIVQIWREAASLNRLSFLAKASDCEVSKAFST